jgi:hypothetical protein
MASQAYSRWCCTACLSWMVPLTLPSLLCLPPAPTPSHAYLPPPLALPPQTQDLASWSDNGITGLQSVVLYSLPELDGAIDTVPLGGLVGDDIFLVPERVTRLASRLHK